MREHRPARAPTRRHRGRPHARAVDSRRRGAPTQARLLALRVIDRVTRARAFADLALNAALSRCDLSARDRAFATELVYGTLRWRGRLDFLLNRLLDRDLVNLDPPVASILRLGAYQIVFADRVPGSAAVDEAVRCARAAGAEWATGLVNAVLRRLAAEHASIALPALEDDPVAHIVHALSYPRWIAERWIDVFGVAEAASLAKAMNDVPPRTVRVNLRRTTREALLAEVRERFPDAVACRYAPAGVQLGPRGNPGRDPAFLDGRFTVQDEASQLVVELLDPQPGERVLDTCAAPGSKANASAERVGEHGVVVALDHHARRLALVSRDARRLGLSNVRAVECDASRPLGDLLSEGPFDRVLVDVPCTGLGVLRRNPDARWRVAPGDVARLAKAQGAILENAAQALRPGGSLVYSTCTLTREENEAVVEAFLDKAVDFRRVARDGLPASVRGLVAGDGFLRCLPHWHDTDGFFAARLERTR